MLNKIISDASIKWSLSNLRPLQQSGITHNYTAVTYSAQYKKDVVLKLLQDPTNEAAALRYFNGEGCVQLIDYNEDTSCLLLEYIQPGTSLKHSFPLHDEYALEVVSTLIKKLNTPKPYPIPECFDTVYQWLQPLQQHTSSSIPAELLKKAQYLAKKLEKKDQEHILLHGDLHHENILKTPDTWIAIDPKGVVGPKEFEVIRFIMNPIPELLTECNAHEIITKRIRVFEKTFGFNEHILKEWLLVSSVLSAHWAETDNNQLFFEYFINLGRLAECL